MNPACPMCGRKGSLKFSKHGFDYYRCPCQFVFIWPRPSEEQLHEMYRRDGEEYWTSAAMIEFAFSASKVCREIAFLKRFASSGRLLDIGCSTGSFVRAALANGFEAEGIDICEPAVQVGQRIGLPLSVLDVFREDFGRQFDIVTMWATLEHLPNPIAALRRANDLVQLGGFLLVSVPNYASLTQRLIHKWDRYVCDEHLNYFTPRVLANVIESQGLQIVGEITFGFNPLMILKDLANRGRQPVNCQQMSRDEGQTLRLKKSPLQYAHRGVERILDLFNAGDALAIAATKEISHIPEVESERSQE